MMIFSGAAVAAVLSLGTLGSMSYRAIGSFLDRDNVRILDVVDWNTVEVASLKIHQVGSLGELVNKQSFSPDKRAKIILGEDRDFQYILLSVDTKAGNVGEENQNFEQLSDWIGEINGKRAFRLILSGSKTAVLKQSYGGYSNIEINGNEITPEIDVKVEENSIVMFAKISKKDLPDVRNCRIEFGDEMFFGKPIQELADD
jgi:hypothetical protein